MTEEQKSAVRVLGRCSFVPASADKRFVRQMGQRLETGGDRPLTAGQDARLSLLLHRYRRQHRACPCEWCAAERPKSRVPDVCLRKVDVWRCPCGAVGTLFGKPGEWDAPRCGLCVGIISSDPRKPAPAPPMPVPGRTREPPYPWLMEERPDPSRVRRVCLSCGESAEVRAHKRGRVTTFSGFARWYRDHIPCGVRWDGLGTKAPDR